MDGRQATQAGHVPWGMPLLPCVDRSQDGCPGLRGGEWHGGKGQAGWERRGRAGRDRQGGRGEAGWEGGWLGVGIYR